MDARRARAHEYLAEELDAYAHWYVAPASSSGGHFLTLTLFAECGNAARAARDRRRNSFGARVRMTWWTMPD